MTGALEKILSFWDERAALGPLAGTNDFVLSGIEQRYLLDAIPTGARTLDIGCGVGESIIRLAKEKGVHGIGFDFSDKMVEKAHAAVVAEGLCKQIEIHRRTLPPVPDEWGLFAAAYSQRSLINLTADEAQREAVLSVARVLQPGGRYFMIESYNDGAEETNALRSRLGLERMEAPWHNRFLDLQRVKSWSTAEFYVEKVVHISSTYHLLSRVVYAKLAQDAGQQLRYDSEINLLAAQLPQEIGEFGPVKACIWRKAP